MHDFNIRTVLFKAVGELHHAAGATGRNGLGSCCYDCFAFNIIDVHGRVVVIDIEGASKAATFIGPFHFNQFNPGSCLQQLTRLFCYTACTEMARVVIGDANIFVAAGLSRIESQQPQQL